MSDGLASRPRLLVHFGAWLLVGSLVTMLLHLLVAVPWAPAAAVAVPLSIAATPMSLSGFYLSQAMPLRPEAVLRVAATVATAAVITGATWSAVGHLWWLFLDRLGVPAIDPGPPQPTAVAPLLLAVGSVAYVVSMALHYVFRAYERAARGERRALESEIAARDAELRALRAQIDPHFLFNSLNSISGLVGVDPDRARAMCQRLGDFLRDSLALGGLGRIPLGREVALVRQYLEIEQVRFGARLQVETDVADAAAGVEVPALLLQPLVENAVRHGVAGLIEGGTVRITAERAGSQVVVTVVNPRDPDAPVRRGTSLGLSIVRRRLAAAFADAGSLLIDATDEQFRAVVTIPGGAEGDARE